MVTIYGYPVFEVDGMFETLIYLYMFYFLFFVEDKSPNIAAKQVMEETYPELKEGGGVMMIGRSTGSNFNMMRSRIGVRFMHEAGGLHDREVGFDEELVFGGGSASERGWGLFVHV